MKIIEKEVQITFEDIFQKFSKMSKYTELLRGPIARHTQRYIDGCRFWDGKYWALCDTNKLESELRGIIIELGEVKKNRQDSFIKDFVAHFAVTETDMDIDTASLLVIQNGVIDLQELCYCWELMGNPTVEDLLKNKEQWFFSHEKYKKNHLTRIANVSLSEIFDKDKFLDETEFFRKTLLVTFGGQVESFEWFMTYIALSLTGENTGNCFCNLYGKQKTGKSTIKDFLADFFGKYFQQITTDCLFKETFNNLEQLYNAHTAKIVNVSEPNNQSKDVSLLKRVTGHDLLVFDRASFTFNASIVIDSNHLIVANEKDTGGFDRRYAVLPCGPVVQNPDSNLLNKLKEKKESFLINILARYAEFMCEREKENKILEKPEITDRTLKIIQQFQNPVQWFFETWCTAFPAGIPFVGGTDIRLTDIRNIFMQGFIEYYENQFANLYFSSSDFYVPLTSISAQKFDAIMKSFHLNYDSCNQGRATVFHNFIVQDPGTNLSIKEFYKSQLVSLRYAADLQQAEEIMKEASKMPAILKKENMYEDNYADLLGSSEFPSFDFFHIVASREVWMANFLQFILSNGLLFSMGNIFTNWLYRTVDQNTAAEIFCKLKHAVMSCNGIFDICYRNPDVISILNTLFNSYVHTARENKKLIKNLMKSSNCCLLPR